MRPVALGERTVLPSLWDPPGAIGLAGGQSEAASFEGEGEGALEAEPELSLAVDVEADADASPVDPVSFFAGGVLELELLDRASLESVL